MHARDCIRRAFAAFVFAVTSSSAFAYTSLIVFGDSLLDNGNALAYNLATPGVGVALGYLVPTNPALPPYPPGATQYAPPGAKNAAEVLAQRLGLPPLAPSTQPGGTNFATGGATTGFRNFIGEAPIPGLPPGAFYPGLVGIGIRTEVAQFATRLAGSPADPHALYVAWGGANDVFLNAALSLPQDPVTSVLNLAATIGELYALGARTILVPNLPDLSKAPAFNTDPSAPALTALTLAFNALLASTLGTLESSLAGLDIIPFDTFGAFDNFLANAASFGITNTTDACFAFGSACDPATFAFLDPTHPSPVVHAILGNLFFAAVVPEPRTTALVTLGLMSLVWVRARALRRVRNGRTT